MAHASEKSVGNIFNALGDRIPFIREDHDCVIVISEG